MIMFEIFQHEFVQNAFLAGTIIAILAAVMGYFVVLRAQAFAGPRGFGSVKVEARIHDVTWRTSVFPLNSGGYPCQVAATLSNGATKSFGIPPTGPPNLQIDCSSATDPDWCSRITVSALPQTPLNHDHISPPSVPKK